MKVVLKFFDLKFRAKDETNQIIIKKLDLNFIFSKYENLIVYAKSHHKLRANICKKIIKKLVIRIYKKSKILNKVIS